MPFVTDEISSQPDLWARAAALADTSAAEALPEPGERVAVVGCGTSLYMARAWASLRETGGAGETDAFPASEFPAGRRYDRVVAITRSGTTTEIVRLLEQLAKRTPTTVLTTRADLPAARLADGVVLLDFADEQSVVQTRFATCALALLRAQLGVDLTAHIDEARTELAAPVPPEWLDRNQFAFLGTGWSVGIAEEAALKLREAAQAWTEAYPAMEYRHGPVSVADERSLVWIFGPPPAGLVEQVRATGAEVVTSTVDPLAHLVRAQRLAVALAEHRGLDPDAPRNLTRSIVLTGA
jgi:fructoselysine-6-P-deglycase FrlB-like protein